MPEEFVRQVRDALAHLYDYPYLQTHALASALARGVNASPREAMRLLRTRLLECIEELNPGADMPLRSPAARSYNVLNLHYVEGLTVQEVARELAISERQAYRDLRQAEGDLAALLCSYLQSADGELSTAVHSRTRVELALEEADRLAGPPQRIDVGELVAGALSAVSRLGEQRGVQLLQGELVALGSLCTDRQLARQALVAMLSFAVQHARPATTITVSGSRRGVEVRLRVDLTLHSPEAPSAVPAIADQFIQRLGGRCATRIAPDGTMSLVLALPDQAHRTVLVIDDHEGLIELFQRYLTGEQYLVLTATNGQQGMRLAIAERPDVIVLDVMMPGEDGWEILEQLSTQQTTRDIPVIVCSVLEEPELALSLGAAGYLAKPVTRMRLLQELASCCRTPPPECSPEPPPQS